MRKKIQACAYVDVLIFCLNKITQNPDKKKKKSTKTSERK